MTIIRCKMCGGDLTLVNGQTVAICEYCGTKQTVPTADSEKKLNLFSRANRLRYRCEFDQAANLYENIVSEFPLEAEAYWGLVLCKYGIEYVDDPTTGKKIPTCHRTNFDNVNDDPNFAAAIKYANVMSRQIYLAEGKAIEELRKNILTISSQEKPYDIFISYKESDDHGNRTLDSVLAQDIYDQLSERNYRVFLARVSLEDKLGSAYEPYIFAALYSSKVMLVVGTDNEYFNAVWVKNEWKRFLHLMASQHDKVLIPCFKDMDPYDLPKEFQKLQAQDLGKVGAMQDLMRGIEKILGKNEEVIVTNSNQPIINEGMLYEIRQRINGPKLIERALSYGVNGPEELWPKTYATSDIDIEQYSRVVFNLYFHNPYTNRRTIQFTMYVYDNMGNAITKSISPLEINRNTNRIAKQWIIKGSDGSRVALGKYYALFWIDNSQAFHYQFQVTNRFYVPRDSYFASDELRRVEEFESNIARQTRQQQTERELLDLQKEQARLEVELSELNGLFSGKKRKQITHDLNIIKAQIQNVKKQQNT